MTAQENNNTPSASPKHATAAATFADLAKLKDQQSLDTINTAKIAADLFPHILDQSDEKILLGTIDSSENQEIEKYIPSINSLIKSAKNKETGGVRLLQAEGLTPHEFAAGGGAIGGNPLVKALCGIVNEIMKDRFPNNSPKKFNAQSLGGASSLDSQDRPSLQH